MASDFQPLRGKVWGWSELGVHEAIVVFAFRLLTRVSLLYLECSGVRLVCLKAYKGRAMEEDPN